MARYIVRALRLASLALLVWVADPGGLVAQQTGAIRGSVIADDSARPLAGVQVVVVGTGIGVLTNDEGTYVLTGVPAGNVRVTAQYIGYVAGTQGANVIAGGSVTLDFALNISPLAMDELIVTATGIQRRVEIGNAISTIDVADIVEDAPITTISDLLTGRAAGVQVSASGGTTGTGSRVRIRGSNSVSISNEPLIYVDGVRVSNDPNSISFETGGQSPSRFDDINPDDIESLEIVKGPSAATLYGTEAANGVIRITTKKGRTGKTRLRTYLELGQVTEPNSFPANFRGIDAAGDLCSLVMVSAGDCVQSELLSFNPLENPATTPFRNGLRQRVGGSVSGSSGAGSTYFLSGSYENEEGVTEVNQLTRVNLRANFGIQPADNLNVSVSTGYLSSDLGLTLNDNFALGLVTNGLGGFWSQELNEGYSEFTPATLFTVDNRQDIERFTGSVSSNWIANDFIEARGTIGLDFANRTDSQFFPTGEAPAFLGFEQGARFVNDFREFNYTADLGASANFDLSPSISSRTSVGVQYFAEKLTGTLSTGRQLVAGTESIGAAAVTESSEVTTESKTLGAFIEERVSFGDRLFLTAAVRADDNSAFGSNFNVVVYPKFSASWLLSEEGFFGESSLFNSLRFRAAWGQSGLQPGTTDALRFLLPIAVTSGGTSVTGVTFGGLGNPNLEPERSSEIEAGFDAQMFDSRVALELTLFNKTTRDALVFRELAPSLGVSQGRFENLGSVRNTGFEYQVVTDLIDNESTSLALMVNGSFTQNELQDLGGVEPIIFRFQRHVEGFPLGGYWDEPIESFSDANGDGIITENEVVVGADPVFLGSPFPTRAFSLQPTLGIFSDRVQIRGLLDHRGGQRLHNFTASWRLGQNNTEEINDPSTPLDRQARAVASKFLGTDAGYMENASFWKLREVAVTFNAPPSFAQLLGSDRVSMTLSGRNLATWTSYSGLDPELNEQGQSNFLTREFMTQPPVRYWIARVNVSF